jgi:6-pyruvoyltetrahydropterin/6-carboxytetrahydropterin synthase
MFEVCVQQSFAAGHSLRNYRGKCENVHGHNYKIEVLLRGEELDSTGLLVDFVEVKRRMHQVIDYLDHQYINDLKPFDEINPSAENIAWFFHQRLSEGLDSARVAVAEVKVWETDVTYAVFRP